MSTTTTNPINSGVGGGSSGGGGAGGSSGGGGGPCGACKFLRRKCVPGCIFAPYFDSEQGAAHFAAVHKVFGASNVSKLLLHIPAHKRPDAVVTICYEAQARLRDPVYGCVAHIFALQQQVVNLQAELSYLQAHLAAMEVPSPPPPPPPALVTPPPFSIADLPSTSSIPAAYDLSSLFDPMVQPSWSMQPRQLDPHQFGGSSTGTSETSGGDLQALARELLHRRGSLPPGSVPCSDALASSSISK
ncbi:PREDICTED: LOB domain-containing protein 18-like [Populus euphratica]|uniref:LOB domain-containing protein 18-like n=1 Tax=Populus euphratica TaxID=75702 RepID=A0AAJ6XGA8_POPEU|nr:PREDICTED: LOB domain-containing protein 18-like [Populus euphratica]